MPDDEKQDIPRGKSSSEIDQDAVCRAAAILGERFGDYVILARPEAQDLTLMAKWSNMDWATGALDSAAGVIQSKRSGDTE